MIIQGLAVPEAATEKKRVSGQKRHDHEARLQKEDDEHRRVDQRPVVGREVDQKMVGVREKIDDELDKIHGAVCCGPMTNVPYHTEDTRSAA